MYILDAICKTSRTPNKNEVYWDVDVVLRNHKKHIYIFIRRPSLEDASRALEDVRNKLAWHHHFKHVDPSSADEWKRLRSKPRRPRDHTYYVEREALR